MDVNENNKEPQPPVEPKDDLKVNANAYEEERRALLDG
jgi:hypothetical protein